MCKELCQHAECEGVVRGRLYNRRVSCKESGGNFLVEEVAWEVEGDDAGNDSDRFSLCDEYVFILSRFKPRGDDFPVEVLRLFAECFKLDEDVSYFRTSF